VWRNLLILELWKLRETSEMIIIWCKVKLLEGSMEKSRFWRLCVGDEHLCAVYGDNE